MRICVHWARLGPYHLARLRAVHTYCASHGAEVVALETASSDAVYEWVVESAPHPFRHECVFPGVAFESIPASEMADAVTQRLDAIDPDAVAITSYSTADAQASLRWCRRHRRVAVMMFDSRAEDAERAGWREAIKRVLVHQFDAALVAGTPQRAYAETLGIPASHVFTPYDVVDNAYFAREAAAQTPEDSRLAGLDRTSPFFLSVTRLTAIKGLHVLLDAYRQYAAAGGQWGLVIVGDGPERAALEAQASDLDGITFAGFKQLGDLPAYYGRAAAFVFQTLKDTWGLAVNEAMACGLPVLVSTGAGCALDLVEAGRNGMTFDPADAASIASTLAWIEARTGHERAAMGERSQAILRSFRPEDFAIGLWAAVEAGRTRADRPLGAAAALVLATIRRVAQTSYAFQSIPD